MQRHLQIESKTKLISSVAKFQRVSCQKNASGGLVMLRKASDSAASKPEWVSLLRRVTVGAEPQNWYIFIN
ncbi:hypothetical protein VNO77_25340 [Canavalia gladiata]|uniref:Uncharacterized protein n=1 Tax=Canavalia gladiata TaxID=3824 RepID=A0AAN9L8J1_CANGL